MTQLFVTKQRNGFKGELLLGEPLAKYTTFHIGGPAEIMALPYNYLDLITLLKSDLHIESPLLILGNGSKMLVKDVGWPGLVISLRKGFNYLQISQTEEDNSVFFRVGAGFYLPKLAWFAAEQGLTGLEFTCGIPGTLGGAILMNAGKGEETIRSLVQSISLLSLEGDRYEISADEIVSDHRLCALSIEAIITEITLKLSPGNPYQIRKKMRHFQKLRIKTEPVLFPSAGSVFKNPKEVKAAQLIENAHLKGKRIGQAQISEVDANYIINLGNASSNDVLALIDVVQNRVFRDSHILLEPEIMIVG